MKNSNTLRKIMTVGTLLAIGITAATASAAPSTIWVNNRAPVMIERGTITNPYRTITKAMRFVRAGQIIKVLPGVYSDMSGELLPIKLKAGIRIEGHQIVRGDSLLTVEGPDRGRYAKPVLTGGVTIPIDSDGNERFVTVIGNEDVTLSNFVFITKDSPTRMGDGVGLLVNRGSMTVSDNTFKGTGHAGITILKSGAPTISANKFSGSELDWCITAHGFGSPRIEDNNLLCANGIDVTQESRAQIIDNSIKNQNTGIRVQNTSMALIDRNFIADHGSYGILMNDAARPKIQNNEIRNNGAGAFGAGVFIFGECHPDLGGGALRSVGRNIFSGNAEWDVMNRSGNDISARFNTWSHRDRLTIDRLDIYDDEEDALAGRVQY